MSIPDRFHARSADMFNYAMSALYEPRIHLLLQFGKEVDRQRLARALRLCLDAEPVLGCRFVPRWMRPYWKRLPEKEINDTCLLREDGDLDGFLAERLDEECGPQLAGLVCKKDGGDLVALKINHQTADAGATKELAYLLASFYRRLEGEPGFSPAVNTGSRSMRQVFRSYLPRRFFALLGKYFREQIANMRPRRSLAFLSGTEKRGRAVFRLRHWPGERVNLLRQWASSSAATVNDVMVAAQLRAIALESGWRGPEDGALRMTGTVDMRRYMETGRGEALCNLSSFFFPQFGIELGDDLTGTVSLVKAEIDRLKQDYMGLGFVFGSYLATLLQPFGLMKRFVRFLFSRMIASGNMPPALTNMGIIDEAKLDFGAPELASAVICVPVNQPPLFVTGLSGFRGSLTMSCGFYESALPADRVELLYRRIDSELPG